MEQIFSDMLARCGEADMVLVGIGEKFQYDWELLFQNPRYKEIEKEVQGENEKEYGWIFSFLQKLALERYPDKRLQNAYENLRGIVERKNYFIITTVTDDYVYNCGLDEKRIVTPCGGFRRMQCDENCSGRLSEPDNDSYEKVKSYFNKQISLTELKEPVCGKCGCGEKFNQLGVGKYAEEGYLSQWEAYTKWLQGTVNKKTCVIELGVGMRLPNIIRWPFEKIVYCNNKAFLYRIHNSLYQLGEQIDGRGIGIKENPVTFLINGFVK